MPLPPADDSIYALTARELNFLDLAGFSALALMFVYIISTCCERKYRSDDDIEAGEQRRTVAQPPPPPARAPDQRRPSRTVVISMRLFQYGEAGVGEANADCSICLDEFVEGEVCRLLPACKHVFHRFCIDQWLRKKLHCPLCRSPVHFRTVYPPPS